MLVIYYEKLSLSFLKFEGANALSIEVKIGREIEVSLEPLK